MHSRKRRNKRTIFMKCPIQFEGLTNKDSWLLIAFFIGCLIFLFIGGCEQSLPACHNETIVINNTVIKEVSAACPNCTICEPCVQIIQQVNNTIYDTSCQDRQSAILQAYIDCQNNLTQSQQCLTDSYCMSALVNCNNTLQDYTNRLDNISWYASKNR